jgi:hypothetical protein
MRKTLDWKIKKIPDLEHELIPFKIFNQSRIFGAENDEIKSKKQTTELKQTISFQNEI